ncbi:MAG: sigma 54-interacting transcriptional regulator [Lentisphaerae bacterium]|nr:sigma 54-interacting transcriptional regulator [Lentisphaerota bacterium]
MKKHRLTDEERTLLVLISKAVFANPFGDERIRLDLKITGLPPTSSRDEQLAGVIRRVSTFISQLESAGHADPRDFNEEDRGLLERAFLFDVFHRHPDNFNRLILDQIQAGDTPCPVPFADDALSLLARRGFSSAQALRTFALFFQVRRAYYFISRGLAGQAPSMRELRRRLWNNIFTADIVWYEQHLWDRMEDFSTLLLGETGSGKGAAAAAIGRSGFIPFDASRRRFAESFTRNFLAVNLAQFPETLIESELFGHRKGAFTGAIEHHDGLLACCRPHGAILLDEIGDVPVAIQLKLLQVLQERAFCPVGSHERLHFRGRIIAATNRPLQELRRAGRFRDDFFYRLCSDVIEVPSLRQRIRENPDELGVLLHSTVRHLAGHDSPALAETLLRTLKRQPGLEYAWPGNVRELEQAVRRILLTGEYAGDTPAASAGLREDLISGIQHGTLDAESLLSAYCALLYQRHGAYEAVARQAGLDRRTVRKYVQLAAGLS